ncbi:hypothetical protein SDC9_71969 [bioreactor metagenome]|uniref:Uncharacterized protein n=1 Tax=bioreactor metagenome TaxID=1076179 RepID=A0A644YAA4_9ZZZZ
MARAVWQHVFHHAQFVSAAQRLAHGIGISGGAVGIRAVNGADGVAQKLTVGSAVGRRGEHESGADPVVPAQHAGTVLRFGGDCLVLPDFFRPVVHHAQGERVRRVVVASVFRGAVLGVRLQYFVTLPVGFERLDQRIHVTELLVEHQILNRQQGVYRGGERNAFDGYKREFRAALRAVQRFVGAPAHKTAQIRRWSILRPERGGALVQRDRALNYIAKLRGKRLIEFLKRGKRARIAGLWRFRFLLIGLAPERVRIGDQIAPAAKRELDGFDEVRVAVHGCRTVVAAHGVFKAPDGSVVEHRILVDQRFHASALGFFQHTRDGAFVKVEQKRRALTGCDHIHNLVEQFFRRVLVQADVRLGFEDGAHLVDDFEEQPGKLVGHVRAVFAQTGDVEELTVARGDALIACLNHCVVGKVAVHPEALENFFGKLTIHAALDRLLPVGQQVLVNAPERNARAGVILVREHQHVREPQRLQRFVKIGRRFAGHAFEIFLHGEQFGFARGVGFLCGEFATEGGVFLRQFNGHVAAGNHCSELRALFARLVGRRKRVVLCLQVRLDAGKAQFEYARIIRD